ncbi:phage tail tape measure protein [Hansschlegelia beijingensis]|uniref:Phage tail tape measure protein n=1 Tax=Hansschlegelia beijingensis TaxID=1133344 RepID=A0A7W6GEI7_9HYPH|nr:phage tail tape measure protein [Hansschlegelia beijingensis]MBB3971942.1 hypothetical protein [Hansschlegelia beijingensis]
MPDADPIVVSVDISAFRREVTEAERLSRGFGRALGDALEGGVVRGRSLTDVLRGLGARLSALALSAALKPVENALGGLFSNLTRGLLGGVAPFAAGGQLSAPGVLASGGAASALADPGAAPPPARGGPAAAAATAPVTVNIATPDIEGFRRSETQVAAALARAVARGRRGL